MDAAIIGVVGSLAGVSIGAATQHYQASIRRRWELEDSKRQERRQAYGRFLSLSDELHGAVVDLMALVAAQSAPVEGRLSKGKEIRNICQRLRAMSSELSLLADEVLALKIEMFSAYMMIYVAQQTARKQLVFDEDLEMERAERRTDLVRDMRNELVGKNTRRLRIRNLLPRRPEPSRRRTEAPISSSLQRLAGEDATTVARA
jgi:hypothetical protein